MTFTVSLDQASERTVSYDYATVAQTATAPADYARRQRDADLPARARPARRWT